MFGLSGGDLAELLHGSKRLSFGQKKLTLGSFMGGA